jgi:hypothetical protein
MRRIRAFEVQLLMPPGVDSDVPNGGGRWLSHRRPPRAAAAATTCCCSLSLSACTWRAAPLLQRQYHPRGCRRWRWVSDRPCRSPIATTRRGRPLRISRRAQRLSPSLTPKGSDTGMAMRRGWIGTDPRSSTRSRSSRTRSGFSRRSRRTCTSARRDPLPPPATKLRPPATSTAP